MNASWAARAFMGLGVTVGLIAASFGFLDVQLNLPDWMVRIAMIKLAVIAAVGLLAGGVLVDRHARSRSTRDTRRQPGERAIESLEHRGSANRQPIQQLAEIPE